MKIKGTIILLFTLTISCMKEKKIEENIVHIDGPVQHITPSTNNNTSPINEGDSPPINDNDFNISCEQIVEINDKELTWNLCWNFGKLRERCRLLCENVFKNPPVDRSISETNPPPDLANNPKGNFPECNICKNGSFPTKNTVIANLYGPTQSCKYYYWPGKYGHIEDRICLPLQDFAEEPCGCN